MFSYIRWFSAVSFVIVVGAAFFLGHSFKAIASRDLVAVVTSNNVSLAQGFVNTTWRPHYGDKIQAGASWYQKFRASGVAVSTWKNYNGYRQMVGAFDLDNFSRDVFKHFEDMPIVQVSIYLTDGTRLISTDQSRIVAAGANTGILSDNPATLPAGDPTFLTALSGQPVSVVEENYLFTLPDGATTHGTLIKTLIPILRDAVPVVVDCKHDGSADMHCSAAKVADRSAQAVIEISYDVTEEWKQLNLFRDLGTGGVILIFLVVIATLLFTSNKAEHIIARQHETNIELAAQAASAQAENRDKSQFLANVSHELRTPLNAIIGFSEFIKSERSGPIANEKYGEYIKDIHSSGVHLLSLINDILDYSKAEADKLEIEISEVDATKSIKNSMRLVSPRAEMAQVALLEEIPREHFIIQTDAKKLKQVMLNLLSNAVKFTPAGGSVTVTMWENVVDGSISIEVRDTGIGIAPKDISRAMAPFGQVDNTLSRKYEGTGLGLPLTRKFVEIMGGTFIIQSEVGKGTVLVITLPKKAHNKNAPVREVASVRPPSEESMT